MTAFGKVPRLGAPLVVVMPGSIGLASAGAVGPGSSGGGISSGGSGAGSLDMFGGCSGARGGCSLGSWQAMKRSEVLKRSWRGMRRQIIASLGPGGAQLDRLFGAGFDAFP